MTRVQIPAYTDRWMMGDRYGVVTEFEMKLARAKLMGRQACIRGVSIERNPYTNRGGGRAYYRAWRSGWLEVSP